MSAPMIASDWRPVERNTLRGFFSLRLASGLVVHECSLHVLGERRWIGLPGKPMIDAEGRQRTDPATGKKLYVPIVEIGDRGKRERFRKLALEAVDRLLGGEP